MPPDAASGHRSTPGIAAAGPLSRLLRAPDVRAEPGALRDAAAHHRRGYFTGFSPAISATAKKAKGKQIRDWHLNRRSSADLSGLASEINPQVQGWINYYGAFYRSELCFLAWRINEHLARWAMHKFKRFRGKYAKAMAWLQKVYQYKPGLFAHWQLIAFT
jgi:RNA-directed DNA polymerase